MLKTAKILSVLTVLVLVLAPSRALAAVDPGLELHWNLDEGSGTVANDDSGHNNPGTLYNGPSYVTGHSGYGVQLNGTNQYIRNNTALNALGTANQPYALSSWVNIPQGTSNGNIVHIASGPSGSGWCIPFLRLQNNHFTATGWGTTNGSVGATSATDPATVVAGQWYQVLTSWDASNGLRLFVDGNLVASTPQPDYVASGSNMYIFLGLGNGACSQNQGFLKGIVDDARIYSRVLNATDVQSISSEGVPVTPAATRVANTAATQTPALAAPDTGLGRAATGYQLAALIVGSLGLLLIVASYLRRNYWRNYYSS